MSNSVQNVLYKFFMRCKKDFIFAAEALLGITVWWGQALMLTSMFSSRFVMCVASRGSGKTFILALYSVLRCMLFPNHKVCIVSHSFRQAKFVFVEICVLYTKSAIFRKCCVKAPVAGTESCSIIFKNGSIIVALPLGDGEKIRGARAHTLIVDEAVKIPGEIFELVLLPFMNVNKDPMEKVKRIEKRKEALARGEAVEEDNLEELNGNQVIMSTTAWFQCSYLYSHYRDWTEFMRKGDKDYKVVSLTYLDAPEGYLDMKILELTKQSTSNIKFAMENLAYWPPDTDGFFPRSILEGAKSNFFVKLKGEKGRHYLVAIDVARESDNIVISVAELDFMRQRHKLVLVRTIQPKLIQEPNGFKVIHNEVRRVIRAFNTGGSCVVRVVLDSGGGGGTIRDMLSEPYTFEDGENEITEPAIFQIEGQNDLHDSLYKNVYAEDRKLLPLRILDFVVWDTRWVNKTAFDMRYLFESRHLTLPMPRTDGDKEENLVKSGDKIQDIRDLMYDEIEELIEECTNIIAEELPSQKGFFRFKSVKKNLKKDRWASAMMLCSGITCIVKDMKLPSVIMSSEGVAIRQDKSVLGVAYSEESNKVDPFAHLMPKPPIQRTDSINIYSGDIRYTDDAALA